jgi:hypothetical protein
MSCGWCGSLSVARLSSIDKKLCNTCKKLSKWELKPNQKSVLIRGKHGDKRILGKETENTKS